MKPKTRKRNTKKQINGTGQKQTKKKLEGGFVPALVAVLGALSPFLAGPISNILNRGADWLGKKIFGNGKNATITTNELLDKLSGDLTINKQQAKAVIRDKLGRLPTKVKVVLPVEKEKVAIQSNDNEQVGAGNEKQPSVDPKRRLTSVEIDRVFRPAFTNLVFQNTKDDEDKVNNSNKNINKIKALQDIYKNHPNRVPDWNPNFKI